MTAQRMIQNFRHSRGVLWAEPDFNAETLANTLAKLGVGLSRFEDVDLAAIDHNTDIFFVDGDQLLDPALLISAGSSAPIAPVIGIVGVEAPSRLKQLAEVGVTAFLRKPIHAAAIYSALFLGVNNYRRFRAMESRLAEHNRRRNGRRFVIKAVVALVQHCGLTDDDAYAALRREAMRRRIGIEEFCEALLADSGSAFPAGWLVSQFEPATPHQSGENSNATHFDDQRRRDGDAGATNSHGGGSDQARRA